MTTKPTKSAADTTPFGTGTPATLPDAVTLSEGRIITTSLKIAEVFGKQHKHVLDAIEKLQVPDSFGQPNFRPTEYEWKNNLGKVVKSKCYEITRDGFTILAMGFTGAKAMQFKLAYIEAFNAMEARLMDEALVDPVLSRLHEALVARSTADAMDALSRLNRNFGSYLKQDHGFTDAEIEKICAAVKLTDKPDAELLTVFARAEYNRNVRAIANIPSIGLLL